MIVNNQTFMKIYPYNNYYFKRLLSSVTRINKNVPYFRKKLPKNGQKSALKLYLRVQKTLLKPKMPQKYYCENAYLGENAQKLVETIRKL